MSVSQEQSVREHLLQGTRLRREPHSGTREPSPFCP